MLERGSGLLLHISSLPSFGGIGDMGPDACCFADRLAHAGQKYWQVLPLNPGNVENGESPYFSTSAFAANPFLISMELLAGKGLLDKNDIAKAMPPPDTSSVDFEAVRKFKTALLEKAFMRSRSIGHPEGFTEFCKREAWWLEDFALFKVLLSQYPGKQWADWPDEYKFRTGKALEQIRENHSLEMERIRFGQYVFFSQWEKLKNYCNSKGITIIGDMPIYVSFNSADVWVNREIFKLDADGRPTSVSGVPPDYFSETGQLWNNPVYDWNRLKASGYDWWAKRMGSLFKRFDIVRIDHFRGLVQYWEVPAGEATAVNGQWNDVPCYDFLDAMKKLYPEFPVIAEDLGTITPDVVEAIKHYGFPGMKVLMFAFGEDNPQNPYLPHNYEKNCLVYTGTHDNNTFRAWFEAEAGKDARERFLIYAGADTGTSTEDAAWDMIRLGMSSVAGIAITPVQDTISLGETARMNNPAVTMGNWKWRLTRSEFESIPFDRIKFLSSLYGRS